MSLIELTSISKVYRMGKVHVVALEDVQLRIEAGECFAIMGPSGSGKSTLMNIVGLLDRPTSGTYCLDGMDVGRLTEHRLAQIRAQQIGFVFQSYNLLPRSSALENVELALAYAGMDRRRHRAREALEKVGLAHRMHHYPNAMSGGEQQRVAIARALAKEPRIILADEPTGNIDSRTAGEIMELLIRLHQEQKLTIAIITPDAHIAKRTRRVIHLLDGRIIGDERSDA